MRNWKTVSTGQQKSFVNNKQKKFYTFRINKSILIYTYENNEELKSWFLSRFVENNCGTQFVLHHYNYKMCDPEH